MITKTAKAAGGSIPGGFQDALTAGAYQSGLSAFDYSLKTKIVKQLFIEKQPEIAAQVLETVRPARNVVKCHRCLGCGKSFAPSKMSALLVLCKGCFTLSQDKGKIARTNFIERLANNFKIYLGVRI